MTEKEYSKEMVFTTNTDNTGKKYKVGYTNKITNAVLNIGDRNYLFKGQPKIVCRFGESVFGDELIVEFLIKGKPESYKSSSKYNNFEIYFPKDEGIYFLERMLAHLKGQKNDLPTVEAG